MSSGLEVISAASLQVSEDILRLEQVRTLDPGSPDEETTLSQPQPLLGSSEKWSSEKSPSTTPPVASLADSVTPDREGEELSLKEHGLGDAVQPCEVA